MPLSENEQRLLEQMERALYAEDPKFASAMRGTTRPPGSLRRLVLGGLGITIGLGALVLGMAHQTVWLSIAGFVVMLLGAAFALSSRRKSSLGVVAPNGTVHPAGRRRRGSLIQRMEERWDRRRDEN